MSRRERRAQETADRKAGVRRFRNTIEFAAYLAAHPLAPGSLMHIIVHHDPECFPERCVCEPEFTFEPCTVETYMAGERAQREWVAECQKRRS
jgi:hypothetical protein